MKAVTFAAAGAAVIGSVNAASHVKHMHAKLHANVARDSWADWESTSPSVEVDPAVSTTTTGGWPKPPASTTTTTTTTTSGVAGGWPKPTTTTSKPVDAATTTSTIDDAWLDWESTTTSSKPVDPATTTSSVDGSWLDWESTSTTTTTSKPVDPASTSSLDGSWLDWESTTTTSSKPVDPASTSSLDGSWLDWAASTSTSSKPVDPATTSSGEHAWDDWVEPTTTITLQSIITTTKYVQPVASTDALSWSDWESTTAAPVAPTTSAPVVSVITSTIVPGWSSAGWFGPSWAVDAGQCAISIVTSYGLPTWRPVPDVSTTTTTTTPAAVSSTETYVWADWASTTTSSVPAVVTTTTSSTIQSTWEEWLSTTTAITTTTTTSIPIVPVTTSTYPAGGWSYSSAVSSSSAVAVPTGGSYPGITPNGNSWGLTYSPYTAQSGCKDAATVAKDLAVIAAKGFTTVRVYSTDCSTLENIGKSARDNGLKLILGVWINASGFSAAQAQVDDIVKWAQWDIVELIVVGNEVIFNSIASAADLASFVSSSKGSFKAAGYTGPVTTTEPLTVWGDSKNSGPLSAVIDVVGANLYAFFNAQISADKAGGFIQAQINELNGIFAGKSIYVLESGWPHSGQANGAAVPSPENQAIALKGIQAAVGAQVVFLSYEDEPWKEPGQFGVEPYWGCVNVF